MTKPNVQLSAGIIALIALLVYTLVHTGGLLARYIEPSIVGYVAALGIEVSIVSLSLRIGEMRRSQQDTKFFLFVLVSVVTVSALANIAEGFYTAHDVPLTIENVQRLDIVEAAIGLAATGLISLIVLALSEILGTDVQQIAAAAERQRKREEKQAERAEMNTIDRARQADLEQDQRGKDAKISAMLDLWRANPDARPAEVYKTVDIARTTYYNYRDELLEAGAIVQNGNGRIVVQD